MGFRKGRNRCFRGLITPSAVLLFSLIILAVSLSFITFYNFINKIYFRNKISFDIIQSIHNAIIENCESGYGGKAMYVFVPPGSRIIFYENKVRFIGVDVEGVTSEAIELMLKSQYGKFSKIKFKINLLRDELLLEYFSLDSRGLLFTKMDIPAGSYMITLECEAFTRVKVLATPSD
ncbi:MAG: hypothetical protein QXM43_00290 [Desulfurococcaceae archaeon]